MLAILKCFTFHQCSEVKFIAHTIPMEALAIISASNYSSSTTQTLSPILFLNLFTNKVVINPLRYKIKGPLAMLVCNKNAQIDTLNEL